MEFTVWGTNTPGGCARTAETRRGNPQDIQGICYEDDAQCL